MKKLEKLNLELINSLIGNRLASLSGILGGTFTTWTGDGVSWADMKVSSGSVDKPDLTGECDDKYDTKVKVDCMVVNESDPVFDTNVLDKNDPMPM